MSEQKPSVGRIVHYVSHGTPIRPDGTQAYTEECRAAVITAVGPPAEDECVGLAVLNPTGMFFNESVCLDDQHRGGTWHWPERV